MNHGLLKNMLCFCVIYRFKYWQIMILRISINRSTAFSKLIDRFVYCYRLAFDSDRLVGNFGQLSNPIIEFYQVCWVRFIWVMFWINWLNQFSFIFTFWSLRLEFLIFLCFFASSHFLVFFVSFIGYVGIPPNDL